ncbi:MAG: CpsD/CapB family tyrosine-protein kinase [Gammaproteobacteria bacterium]|nr:CpsD/CapB family tyrosine-protein kinase [Gammaproteobacteria bacterium]
MINAARQLYPPTRTRPDLRLQAARKTRTGSDEIDFQRVHCAIPDVKQLEENRILTGFEPDQFRESYNLLRTQILHRFRKNNWQVLAVTSPGEGEGTSLTAINLAISIAREIAYSVLLVDANLRQPRMLDHFGIPARRGLGDYLTGEISVEELLVKPGQYEDLVILPGGKPLERSAEMLNSPRMKQLVRHMRSCSENRIVIFDLPPVLSSTDTLTFAAQTDAALLVIEDGYTQKQDLEDAVQRLGNIEIAGTVLNKSRD